MFEGENEGFWHFFMRFWGCGCLHWAEILRLEKCRFSYHNNLLCIMVIFITSSKCTVLLCHLKHDLLPAWLVCSCCAPWDAWIILKFALCWLFSVSTCNCSSCARSGRTGLFACICGCRALWACTWALPWCMRMWCARLCSRICVRNCVHYACVFVAGLKSPLRDSAFFF